MDAPHQPFGTAALALRSLALVASMVWSLLATEAVLAQTNHQKVYSIERADVAAVAERVRGELGDRGAVFADTEARKLYVQALPESMPRVTELVAAMDRPPAAETAAASQLTSYAIPEARSNAARGWAATYQSTDGSRVAYDERTNQLLVMGSPALHTFVKQQVLALDTNPAAQATQVAQPTHRPLPEAPQGNAGQLTLRHTPADQLHRQLEQLLHRALPVTTDNSGQWISFRAELTPESGVGIDIHRPTGQVQLQGSPQQVAGWSRVLQAIDVPPTADSATQLIATTPKTEGQVRQTLQVIQAQTAAGSNGTGRGRLVSQLFQPAAQQGAEQGPAQAPLLQPAPGVENPADEEATVAVPAPALGGGAQEGETEDGALLGPVQIQFVEGSDMILIRGNKRDVARVMEIINRIEQISAETVPAVEVLQLQHVDSRSMGQLIERVYSQILAARTGSVSITPLGKPNALLLVGRPENVRTAIELVKKIDQPVEPTTRFDVFPLQFASATDAKALIDAFLVEQETDDNAPPPGALAPRAHVVADVRTNALVVSAGPREMAEIASLIQRIDVNSSAAVDMVRIFPLRNTVAVEMAEVLRTAVLGSPAGDTRAAETGPRVSALQLLTIDPENQQKLESSILSNIRIAAESQANTLIVTAPAETMELIAALIEQLDRSPTAEAEIKVFTIVNGDAQSLTEMLISLFGAPAEGGGVGAGESSLVRLQFSVDARTNSIIAAGTTADLAVVHAILLRLDASDVRQRQTKVYRLKNSPAESVALALNDWLRTEREAVVAADLAISPFEQIEREVVIVPELVSNSLIVSATPRYYAEISKLIDELDERPAMVVIQVLIAEVRLNDTDEFGIELGLQDSLLFDRSVLDTQNFTTVTNSTTTQSAGGATVTTQQQNIVNSPLVPGFNFNNQPLGNNGSSRALANAGNVAAQGLSHFALNRVNSELGFGGFVFSASSNSVSALLRALQESRRLEVLSRPQVTALDNQEAIIRVGQRVPRVQTTNITQFGQQNSVVYEDVGINMMVRPRISPDGMVVMELQAEKSQVGSEQEGIPIFSGLDGNVVRAPRIDQTVAYSTVAAASGQTIVLSGLMTKETFDIHRRVPLLADIPLLGDLFRYDSVSEQRTELLIILTPRVIRSELDAEMVKQVESSRMSWVLCDVVNMHGPSGLRSRCDEWTEADSESVFPTLVPGAEESVPTPAGNPPYIPPGPAPSTEADNLSRVPAPAASSPVSPATYSAAPESQTPTYLPPALYPGPEGN